MFFRYSHQEKMHSSANCKRTQNYGCQSNRRRFLHLRYTNRKSVIGFSAIELMITVAIFGILAGIAAPNLMGWVANNRLESAAVQIRAALNAARMESIAQGQESRLEVDNKTFSVCISRTTKRACSTAPDADQINTSDWNTGQVSLGRNGAISDPISFDPRGRLIPRFSAITLTFCDDRGAKYGYIINVNQVGRTSLNKLSDVAGGTCL